MTGLTMDYFDFFNTNTNTFKKFRFISSANYAIVINLHIEI